MIDTSTLSPATAALIRGVIAQRAATGLTVEIFTNGRLFVAHASSLEVLDRWMAAARRKGEFCNIVSV